MKTCVIHIGMPKTGTTSLQSVLFSAREELLENSVNYFSYSVNHNALAAEFGRLKAKGPNSLIGIDNSESGIKCALIEAVKTNKCSKFIISAEALGMILPVGVENMYNLLKPYFDDFLILSYVREPFGYARSAAQQHIKAGSVSEKLISNTLNGDQPGWGNVLPRYRRRLENYVKVFGKKNIKVREFDRKKLKNQDIVDDFLIECLRYEGDTSGFMRVNTNTSLSVSLGNLYEQLNRQIPLMIDGTTNPARSVSLILRLKSFSEKFETKDPFVLFDLDPDAFLKKISSDMDWLKTEFGVTFDLRKPLWVKRDVDLKEIALLTNFLSNSIDDVKSNLSHEQMRRIQCETSLKDEQNFRQFLQHIIQILKGHGKIEDFERLTEKITNVQFLESNRHALNNENGDVFRQVVERRIERIKNDSLD